jgi:arylformamidase
MVRFFDVSMALHEGMIVYPGNPQLKVEQYASIPTDETNESIIHMGCHNGTHVDAKKHISNGGTGSIALPLDDFFGKCRVLDLSDAGSEIHKESLKRYPIQTGDIVLLKTINSREEYINFNADYAHVKIDAARYLVDKGVKTLGFDYLSVKKFQSDPEVHEVLINNLTLIEGLNLSSVSEGTYLFVGFPLKIDADASPLRAVLIETAKQDFNDTELNRGL